MSLFGPYDPQNLFAKIIRGDLPCAKVFEDDHALAFLDLYPQAQGHTLVLPKSPARTILDVDEQVLSHLIVRVQRIARGVREALQSDGVTMMQFNGSAGGQTVFHLHFHIIPRWEGQSLMDHRIGGQADPDDLAKLAERIRATL